MASPPDRRAGTQMTVEVMKSFCRSSDDLQALEEREESEQSPVRSVSGSLRRWQVSETPSPPLSPVPADDMVFQPQRSVQELLDIMLNTSPEELGPEEREKAKEIGDRLKLLGDNMDKTMTKEIRTVLMHPNQEIQDIIKKSIRGLKTVTAKTVVKVLQLGLQLLLSAPPSAQLQQESTSNESHIAENIVELIIEEITTLVTENGGWDQVLNTTDQPSSPSRPHSSSTPTLPQYHQASPSGSSSSETELERNWRSQSFSASRPVPIRPRQPHLSEPNSVPSSPTASGRGRSMSSSLVTIGVTAAFGFALMSYLQS